MICIVLLRGATRHLCEANYTDTNIYQQGNVYHQRCVSQIDIKQRETHWKNHDLEDCSLQSTAALFLLLLLQLLLLLCTVMLLLLLLLLQSDV
jgi:hypothetical protein